MNSLLALDVAESTTDPADWWPPVLNDRTATLAAADAYMTARTDEHEDYADYRHRMLAELEERGL
ncbi:hypothetical protein [Cellulosimicrobium funkei]|uniref:hypothetical protein n=1 Tax=Cellulosimicrobium funkei TaxID=264251 RepID=UPI003425C7E4